MALKIRCSVCTKKSATVDNLNRHLCQVHLLYFPFECEHCETFSSTQWEMIDHYEAYHSHLGTDFRILFHCDTVKAKRLKQLVFDSMIGARKKHPKAVKSLNRSNLLRKSAAESLSAIEFSGEDIDEFKGNQRDEDYTPDKHQQSISAKKIRARRSKSIKYQPNLLKIAKVDPDTNFDANSFTKYEHLDLGEYFSGLATEITEKAPLYDPDFDLSAIMFQGPCDMCHRLTMELLGSDIKNRKDGFINHLIVAHLKARTRFCVLCGWSTGHWTLRKCRGHMVKVHGKDPDLWSETILDRRWQCREAVLEMVEKWFGQEKVKEMVLSSSVLYEGIVMENGEKMEVNEDKIDLKIVTKSAPTGKFVGRKGQKPHDPIWDFYRRELENGKVFSICGQPGCPYKNEGSNNTNLKRHLKTCHSATFSQYAQTKAVLKCPGENED